MFPSSSIRKNTFIFVLDALEKMKIWEAKQHLFLQVVKAATSRWCYSSRPGRGAGLVPGPSWVPRSSSGAQATTEWLKRWHTADMLGKGAIPIPGRTERDVVSMPRSMNKRLNVFISKSPFTIFEPSVDRGSLRPGQRNWERQGRLRHHMTWAGASGSTNMSGSWIKCVSHKPSAVSSSSELFQTRGPGRWCLRFRPCAGPAPAFPAPPRSSDAKCLPSRLAPVPRQPRSPSAPPNLAVRASEAAGLP